MLVYQKKTCPIIIIALSHFVTWKLLKKASKSSFLHYYNGAQKHEGFVGFEYACFRAKTYLTLTSIIYVHFYARYCWWRHFCDDLECVYVKYKSRASTARELPDWYMGLSVKTWLLISIWFILNTVYLLLNVCGWCRFTICICEWFTRKKNRKK